MQGLFNPEIWDGNIRTQTREFERVYYHSDLSAEDLDRVLEWARGQAP